MASKEISRRDANGNIISKNNNYHISFKKNFVEIIYIQSFKKSLILEEDYNIYDNFEEDYDDKFDIEEYKQTQIEYSKNNDDNSISNGCHIF